MVIKNDKDENSNKILIHQTFFNTIIDVNNCVDKWCKIKKFNLYFCDDKKCVEKLAIKIKFFYLKLAILYLFFLF